MWVGVVGTSSGMPDSSPGLGSSASLPPSSAAGHGQLQGQFILDQEKSPTQTRGIVPLLLPAWAPHLVGLAGCESFRQQNLHEVNVTCAEPLSKPIAGKVDDEILVLYHSLETGLSLLFCLQNYSVPPASALQSGSPSGWYTTVCTQSELVSAEASRICEADLLRCSPLIALHIPRGFLPCKNRGNSSAPKSSSKSSCLEVEGGKTVQVLQLNSY